MFFTKITLDRNRSPRYPMGEEHSDQQHNYINLPKNVLPSAYSKLRQWVVHVADYSSGIMVTPSGTSVPFYVFRGLSCFLANLDKITSVSTTEIDTLLTFVIMHYETCGVPNPLSGLVSISTRHSSFVHRNL